MMVSFTYHDICMVLCIYNMYVCVYVFGGVHMCLEARDQPYSYFSFSVGHQVFETSFLICLQLAKKATLAGQ